MQFRSKVRPILLFVVTIFLSCVVTSVSGNRKGAAAAASLPLKKATKPSPLTKPTSSTTTSTSTTTPPTIASITTASLNREGASIPNEVFNLVKSIVGAGVLGLPAGIAAFGNAPSALLPALLLICTISGVSAYGFSLIGRVCAYTGATSYRDAWDKSVSTKTSWIPALCCVLVTLGSVVAYSMILSDTIPQLLEPVFGVTVSRTQALFSITLTVLLPLCLLKELKSLAPFSLVGISGMIYTTLAMAVRYFGKAYSMDMATLTGPFPPMFGTKGASAILHPNAFILVSMLSTASMSHYLAHKFYRELENNTIERFQTVVSVSFIIATALFCAVAALGFLTFGGACQGLVLNNYSTKDTWMSFSRVAVAVSLLTSYPLAFTGVRDGCLDLVGVVHRPNSLLNSLTIGLLSLVTLLAYHVHDLKFILSFGGATWGNALIYLFPTYMFFQCAKKFPELKKEVPMAIVTGILGLGMGIVGTARAIESM